MITKLHKLVCFFSFCFYHAKSTISIMKGVIFMNKILSKEQVEEQRLCYAVKACHLMGFDVEKTADLLEVDVAQVKMLYNFIEKDMIDFNSK